MANKSDINALFIERIKALRGLEHAPSQKEIVEKLGWDESVLSNVLAGRRKVPVHVAEKFFKIYKNLLPAEVGTPVYDLHASATQVEYSGQLPETPSFHINVPGYEDCNFGMYVFGHSMYPTIETGSLILCRKVSDKAVIMYGEIYLIRTKDYLMVKRLQKADKKTVLCTSDNFEKRAPEFKRYESFEVEVDKIIDLYLVKGIIKKTQS